jgi:hypothetical protein
MKEIPNMVNQRLCSLSCNEDVFNRAKPPYEKALADSGFHSDLNYKEEQPQEVDARQKRKRKRKTIWFNPPYSSNVRTNIGSKFLKLIQEHFPPNHRYSKIFNRYNIKLSYSCMPNVSSTIKQHNTSLLHPEETNGKGGCNCQVGGNCPHPQWCMSIQMMNDCTTESQRDISNPESASRTHLLIIASMSMRQPSQTQFGP